MRFPPTPSLTHYLSFFHPLSLSLPPSLSHPFPSSLHPYLPTSHTHTHTHTHTHSLIPSFTPLPLAMVMWCDTDERQHTTSCTICNPHMAIEEKADKAYCRDNTLARAFNSPKETKRSMLAETSG